VSFVLNLTTDELEALRQLETSVDAGRSKVPAPLWAALTTVRGKLRKLDLPHEAGMCPCRVPYACTIEDQRGR